MCVCGHSRALFLLYSCVQVIVCAGLKDLSGFCPSVPGWGCQSMCALWCCWCSSCDVGCACAFRLFPLSSLLFPLCAMVPMLLVWSVVVVPLSLPAVADCGVVYVYSVLGLWSPGLESVPEAP